MMRVCSVIILCPLAVLVYLCALHHYITFPQATVSVCVGVTVYVCVWV